MRRLSPLLCLSFVAGAGSVQLMPVLAPLLPLLLLSLLMAGGYWRFAAHRHWIVLLLFFFVGVSYATARAQWRLTEVLPPDLVWQDMIVEGVVDDFADISEQRTRFDFVVDHAATEARLPLPVALPVKVRLTHYHRQAPPNPLIAHGNRLRFAVRLRPPTATRNPQDFDYVGYLFANNIRLVGYVRPQEEITRLDTSTWQPRRWLHQRIKASGATHNELIAALVIGDRSRIEKDQWRVLRRTGTAHLVSVSGVHIGFIFLLATLLTAVIWRSSSRCTQLLPVTAAALCVALPLALAYALIAGFAVPVQRSFLMASVAAVALLLGGTGTVFAALALAMLMVVLLDPWALLAPGFWLSFLLTAAVLMVVHTRNGRFWWGRLLLLQLLLSIVAIPLTLWFFNEASLIAPLANVLAIQVIGLAVLPLSLLGVFFGDWCWHLAGWLLHYTWVYLHWLADFPYATWTPAQPPLGLFLLALGGSAWLLLPRAVPWRWCGTLPIAAMLLWQPPPLAPGSVQMTVLDVGQGTAVVLQTREHLVVYDTGRYFGGRTIADYLRAKGIHHIDQLLISHDDDDHRGGLPALLQQIDVTTVLASDGDRRCNNQQQWQYDGVQFQVLYPFAEQPLAENENDRSCVLQITSAAGKRALLTGDLSATAETHVATAADVLLVSHHGSRYSSGENFLQVVNPTMAVISVGRNEYGHPHPDTLARLNGTGTTIYRTDQDGALTILLDAQLTITRARDNKQRYWQQ
ncbi:MAG: DNA internalization-related competence protein ComEC/Rec2 [Proteobacteria bacterium]|nr:DNA internalization-related competence protein ComEC/Rec2 [Pseudomonadota bacterium]